MAIEQYSDETANLNDINLVCYKENVGKQLCRVIIRMAAVKPFCECKFIEDNLQKDNLKQNIADRLS